MTDQPARGADGAHATFCRLCEAFCGMVATVVDNQVVTLKPDRDNPHSLGHICIKGPAMLDITSDPERIVTPLKRTGGPGEFQPVSWDEALEDIARRMARTLDDSGPDSIALYMGNPGAFATNTLLAIQMFLKAIGSTKFYTPNSQDTASRLTANHFLYGKVERSQIPDFVRSDFVIILGANPLVTHGSIFTAPRIRHDLDAVARRGRVVVVDPRRTETARQYEHIPIRPDSDVFLLAAMLRTIFEQGRQDRDFLDANAIGWEDLRDAVFAIPVADAAAICGIAETTISELSVAFARAERAVLYSRLGVCRGTFPTLTSFLVDALNIVTGRLGKKGGALFPQSFLEGENTGLSGYGETRSRVGDYPSVAGMLPATVMADDITDPGDGRVKAMLIVSGNPVSSVPGSHRLEAALSQLDLMVSLDLYMTETSRHAHYILPGTTFLEQDDIPLLAFTQSLRPYMQYADAAVTPRGKARHEHRVLQDIAKRMARDLPYPSGGAPLDLIERIFREGRYGDAFGQHEGWSFASLAQEHPHGVMLDDIDPAAGWRHGIGHADFKIHLWCAEIAREWHRLRDARSNSNGLLLYGRRDIRSMNSWMHNTDNLVRSQKPVLLIHPDDASERGIKEGDMVELASVTGHVEIKAALTSDIVAGAVCYPHGWGHQGGWTTANAQASANINIVIPGGVGAIEAISGMSIMDGIPVTLRKSPLTVSGSQA